MVKERKMKAINFLEWFKGYYRNADQKQYFNYFDAVKERADFYSTPFKPELITELFEGWEYETNTFQDKIYKAISERFDDGDNYWFINFLNNKSTYWNGLSIPKPLTLNDFISDCQRAGIELNWKPEIERKYFV